MSTPEVKTSRVLPNQYLDEPREIEVGRFGIISTGREYAYQFYCKKHRTFDSAEVALPHNINPKMWAEYVDSQIRSKICGSGCRKRLISIEPIYVTTEPQRGPGHIHIVK